jgi:hypothetical protein
LTFADPTAAKAPWLVTSRGGIAVGVGVVDTGNDFFVTAAIWTESAARIIYDRHGTRE